MAFKKFQKRDVLRNVIETHPQVKFDIYDAEVYYNERTPISGAFTGTVGNVPSGFVSLYDLNVDRNAEETGLIYPFVVKGADRIKFKSQTLKSFSEAAVGETLIGSYPMSASITRSELTSSANYQFNSLINTLDYYAFLNPDYATCATYDFSTDVNLISIPSIFYGSSIKKGSIDLKFFVTGSLIGRLQDERQNGQLIQTGPAGSPGSGSCVGVALYNEGFLFITASYDLSSPAVDNYAGTGLANPSWFYYGVGANDGTPVSQVTASSYSMEMQGRQYVPTLTMMAHADKGEMNHSNNKTYIQFGQTENYLTGTSIYQEPSNLLIKNTVSSSYVAPDAPFQKVTYISKIGIYDKDKNLIGIATTSSPVKKTQDSDLTFKLKLDL